jgi:hypothetical protein
MSLALNLNFTAEEASILEWRSFRPLFEEESIVDQKVSVFTHTLENGSVICINQNPSLASRDDVGSSIESASATGAVLWDSSVVVARFLEASSLSDMTPNLGEDFCDLNRLSIETGRLQGKQIVELGSGTGFLACVCHFLGAMTVVASEREELMPLLLSNINDNRFGNAGSSQSGRNCLNNISATPFMWGDPLPIEFVDVARASHPLMIVAIDCVYDEEAVSPLLDSICEIFANVEKFEMRGEPGFDQRTFASDVSALVAVDATYNRPRAWRKFMEMLSERGLSATELSLGHMRPDHRRESVRLWRILPPSKQHKLPSAQPNL